MEGNRILKTKPSKENLMSIINNTKDLKVGVIGDGCLDIYLDTDMRLSKLSRETPHYPLPVVDERIYPGGGTNVALNMKDLGSSLVYMLSLVGKDWRGESLISELEGKGINTQFMVHSQDRITPAYCKPLRRGYSDLVYEDPRIDFENRSPLAREDEASIIQNLYEMSEKVDIIAVCDQFDYGIINESVRDELEKLAQRGKKIIVDSRSRIGLFRHTIIKPNEMEAIGAAYDRPLSDIEPDVDMETIMEATKILYERNGAPIIITMGDKGSLWYHGEEFHRADPIPVDPPIDIVGAGDAFLAAFTLAYGAGFAGHEAIVFGNLASSIVIQKIGMAGTATPEELVRQHERVKVYE